MKKTLFLLIAGITALGLGAEDVRILKADLGGRIPRLNPLMADTSREAQVFTALYEGLTAYDPLSLKPLPGAAESWEVSPDQKTFTFKLRKDLVFSDGTPITAQTFLDSWKTAISPDLRSPFAFLLDDVEGFSEYRLGQLKDFTKTGAAATDPQTLVLKLKEPVPQLLSILGHYSFSPLHPAQSGIKDWNLLKTVYGNGPYVVKSITKDLLILERNPRYWDVANVAVPGVELTFSQDGKAITEAFRRGNYDWLAGEVDLSLSLDKSSILVHPMFAAHYFYFFTDGKPWTDYRVRKALIQLLPLEDLRKKTIYPGTTLVPPFQGYPDRKGVVQGTSDLALKLLEEAGFPKGKGLGTLVIKVPDNKDVLEQAQIMKSSWEKALELKVTIEAVPWRDYEVLSTKGGFQIGYQGWIADFPDPLAFLLLWKTQGSLNVFKFSDPAYDDLLKKATALPWEKRLEALAKAEDFLLDRGALVPMGYSTALNLIDLKNIGGWYPNPLDLHPFKNLFFKPVKSPPNVVMLFDHRGIF